MLDAGQPSKTRKTWEELVILAAKETDPEKVASIAEEIFAALEERERTLSHKPTELAGENPGCDY